MRLYLSVLFLFIARASFAQYQDTYYLKNNGKYVSTKDSADYMRIVTPPDSGSTLYNVKDLYLNNSLKRVARSAKREFVSLEGAVTEYYPNGLKRFSGTYTKNELTGMAYYFFKNGKPYVTLDYGNVSSDDRSSDNLFEDHYRIISVYDTIGNETVKNGNGFCKFYPRNYFKNVFEQGLVKNGYRDSIWTGNDPDMKVKFTERYADGKLLSGMSTDSTGKQYSYSGQRVSPPQYSGGVTELYAFIGKNVKYPKYARENDIHGTVVLSFVVKKDGHVGNIKILKSVHPVIDAEAIRVIQSSKNWLPGSNYGIPVNIYYTIPLSFTLKG